MNIHLLQPARLLSALYVAGCFVILSFASVLALATGYSSDDAMLQPGMAVSLSESSDANNPKVERASSESSTQSIGVSVNSSDNLVTTGAQSKQIYVQTDGEVDVYVSDINGNPKKGDLLSTSPLKGILVVSDDTSRDVVGTALEDFNADGASTQSIDKAGQSVNLKINKVRISLDQKGQSTSDQNSSSLERLGESVTGKKVGEIRVVIALILFLIVLIAEGAIIHGAISSAITALGRNPMARKTIIKEMVRVIFVAIIVLVIGLASIYMILWV